MACQGNSIGWSLLAVVLGAAGSLLAGFYTYDVASGIIAEDIISGIAVFILIGLIGGPFGTSFLLTTVIPRTHNWALSCGQVLFGGLIFFVDRLGHLGRLSGIGWVAPFAALIAWGTGYAGVRAARRWLPERCRAPRRLGPRKEPKCPSCKHVLYFAQGQHCPECGGYFRLTEVDMRQAQWDGYMLRPWPAPMAKTGSTSHP